MRRTEQQQQQRGEGSERSGNIIRTKLERKKDLSEWGSGKGIGLRGSLITVSLILLTDQLIVHANGRQQV